MPVAAAPSRMGHEGGDRARCGALQSTLRCRGAGRRARCRLSALSIDVVELARNDAPGEDLDLGSASDTPDLLDDDGTKREKSTELAMIEAPGAPVADVAGVDGRASPRATPASSRPTPIVGGSVVPGLPGRVPDRLRGGHLRRPAHGRRASTAGTAAARDDRQRHRRPRSSARSRWSSSRRPGIDGAEVAPGVGRSSRASAGRRRRAVLRQRRADRSQRDRPVPAPARLPRALRSRIARQRSVGEKGCRATR